MDKGKKWYRVDNVANIFLATVTNRDPRSLRISCTLKEEIRPEILDEALQETITLLPQFHVRIHRGFFWHYIDDADAVPHVRKEYRRICPALYETGSPYKLHYELSYFENRINLDLCHAISDGTGAIEFMNFIVYNYLKRLYPDITDDLVPDLIPEELSKEDSYKQFYEKEAKAPDSLLKAFKPTKLKYPYEQLQFMEVHMPSSEIRKRAKELNVSVTSFIGAKLIMAFLKEMSEEDYDKPVILTLPVNLRKYYPSKSMRNFFNNIALSYKRCGEDSLEHIAHEFDKTLKTELEPEKIKLHMNHFQKLQQNLGVRVVPLILKQPALRFATWVNDQHVSAILSNLGSLNLPESISEHIDYFSLFCSSQNPFFCCGSFKDKFVIGITNPYRNTNVIRNFVRGFSRDGIPVKLYSSEVVV